MHELLSGNAALEGALAAALAELADATAELTRLEADLAAVAAQQSRRLGPLYARLADLKLAILMAKMRDEPLFAALCWERAKAEFEPPAQDARPEPDAESRALWKALAKRLHPDRAIDVDDRAQRETWMKRLTQAWAQGDLDELRRIDGLTRDRVSDLPDAASGVADELTAARAELSATRLRIAELTGSDLARVLRRWRSDAEVGLDYFAGRSADLELQIMSAEQELQEQAA